MCACSRVLNNKYTVHIRLAMTFILSHLVCCNNRRTVGSLWRSCVISRRVTHLEPSHRADKPLLCLGHLEGRDSLLPSTYESILSCMVIDISHSPLYDMLRRCGCRVMMLVTSMCTIRRQTQFKSETTPVRWSRVGEKVLSRYSNESGFFQTLIQGLHILQNSCCRRKPEL